MFCIDKNLVLFIQNINFSTYFLYFIKFITNFGSFSYIFTINLFILFYLYFDFKKNKTNEKIKLMTYGIFGQILTFGITQTLKYVFARTRPYKYFENLDLQKDMFLFFNYNNDYVSFPSGHSSAIWALIISLIITFNKNIYIKIICLFFGIIVPISRLILNVHYLSDIIYGSFLGICITKILIKYLKQTRC